MDREVRLERLELKYLVPASMVEDIASFAQIYCEKDPFSEKSEDGYYTVNSLYLDSPNYELLSRRRAKVMARFNLRIRSYGDGTEPPYFFEVKNKRDGVVDKLRAKTLETDWAAYMTLEKDPSGLRCQNQENLDVFFKQALSLQAEPKILTQYKRLAYFSIVDEYARVTFDRNLRYQNVDKFTVNPDERAMNNYDISGIFGGNQSMVVLELKCHKQVPAWMIDLIQQFNLTRRSFSKYANSIESSLFDYLDCPPGSSPLVG